MKIYCDGGARGNPGPAAAAFVVYSEEGDEVYKASKFLGESTNNVAEYSALIMALTWVASNATEKIEIVMDSELVKKQMTGEYRIKNYRLQVLAGRAKKLESSVGQVVVYKHVPRSDNRVSDQLVNDALDEAGRKV